MAEEFLTIRELAQMIHLSYSATLRRLHAGTLLPAIKNGNTQNSKILFKLSDVKNWIAEQEKLTGLGATNKQE